jgi:hypothetical protein
MANLLIRSGPRTAGPYTPEETRAFIDAGSVAPDSLAWTEGLLDWAPLDQVLTLLTGRPTSEAAAEFTSLDRRRVVPDGVRGFSWGAFVLGPFWSVGNRVWVGLWALVPGLGQLVSVWLGFHGRELAWQRGRWADVQSFQAAQRKWSIAAAVALPLLVAGLVALALAVQGQGAGEAAEARPAEPNRPAAEPRRAPAGEAPAPITERPIRDAPNREAPVAERRALAFPASRDSFERALRDRGPEQVQSIAGRPTATQREQGVLVYVYREATLNPASGAPDAAALVLFIDERAGVFRYIEETER